MNNLLFLLICSIPEMRGGLTNARSLLRAEVYLPLIILLSGFILSGCSGHPQPCKKPSGKQVAHSAGPHLAAESYSSFDHSHFPFRKWLPLDGSEPSIIVIGLHGISGASQDFQNLGTHLQESMQGAAVYAPELRGQGNDPVTSRRGDIQSREDWINDLQTFTRLVRQQHPQACIIWHGESMGALIALHGLASFPDKRSGCNGLILSSPIVGTHREVPSWKRNILRLASGLFPRIKISLETLGGKDEVLVTNDSVHQEQSATNPYHVPAFTLRLLNTLGGMIESSPQCAKTISLPVLILHGGHDIFSRPDAVQAFSEQFSQSNGVRRNFYPESYHLLLYGHERDRILSDISEWILSLSLP